MTQAFLSLASASHAQKTHKSMRELGYLVQFENPSLKLKNFLYFYAPKKFLYFKTTQLICLAPKKLSYIRLEKPLFLKQRTLLGLF